MMRPALALSHMGAGRANRAVVALEVDPDDVVPLLLAHVEDHPVAQDSRDVDQDVELAELLDRLFDEALAAGHGRDIHVIGDGLAAGLPRSP